MARLTMGQIKLFNALWVGPTDSPVQIGASVKRKDDARHVGVIERVDRLAAYVRWSKGFATWEKVAELEVVP